MKRKLILILCLVTILALVAVLAFYVIGNWGDPDRSNGKEAPKDAPETIEVVFSPENYTANLTDEQKAIVKEHLMCQVSKLLISDYSIRIEGNDFIVSLPRKNEFDWPLAEKLAREATARTGSQLRFYYDTITRTPSSPPSEDQFILGTDMLQSVTTVFNDEVPGVELQFTQQGTALFANATEIQAQKNQSEGMVHTISIWLTYTYQGEHITELLSNPIVSMRIDNGIAFISGSFIDEYGNADNNAARELTSLIGMSTLPFNLTATLPE